MRYPRAILAVLFMFACACGFFSCESPIERERRELAEASESSEAVLYRALKVSLRSAPLDENAAPPDASSTKIRALTASVFAKLARGAGEDDASNPALSVEDYVVLAKEIMQLRKELREADEDDYPTLLSQLSIATDSRASPELAAILTWYDAAWEHLVLAMLWTASQKAPAGFVLYELGQLDPSGLHVDEVRVAARLVRAIAFWQRDWPWLTDDEATAYLDDLAASRAGVIAGTRRLDGAPAGASDDVVYAQWHAPGVLVRGLARNAKEQEDAALDDFDAFLSDAETLGLDEEGVWLVGAYVGIKRDDPERALTNLRKLRDSAMFGDDERKLFDEAIVAIEKRDRDSAFNRVTDKVLVAKIVGGYALRVLAKMQWREQLQASESGRALLRTDAAIHEEVDRIKNALSPSQLADLGHDAAQSAKSLGKKAADKAAEAWHKAADN